MNSHLEFNPTMRIHRTFHEEDDEYIVNSAQDVTEIVEANKASMAAYDERERWGDGDRVASIPMGIYMQLQREGIADDEKAFRKWLDDPKNFMFRTRPGKLSR